MERLCIATKDGSLELLNCPYESSQPRLICQGNTPNIIAVSWYYSNEVIAVAGRKISLVRAKTGTSLGTLNSPNNTDICFSSKSHYLYSSCEDKKVRIWDLKLKQLSNSLELDSPGRCVGVNRNDTVLATGLKSGKIILHSIADNYQTTPTFLQEKNNSPMTQLYFSSFKSSVLGTLNERGDVNVWDVNKQKVLASFSKQHSAPAKAAGFSRTNRAWFLTGGADKKICLFDVTKQQLVASITTPLGGILDLSTSVDGFSVCAALSTGSALLYDLRQFSHPYDTIVSSDESGIVRCDYQCSKVSKRTGLVASSDEPRESGKVVTESIPIPGLQAPDFAASPPFYNSSGPRSMSPLSFGSRSYEARSPPGASMLQQDSPKLLELGTKITKMREDVQVAIQEMRNEMIQQFNKQQKDFNTKFNVLQEQNAELLQELKTLRDSNK